MIKHVFQLFNHFQLFENVGGDEILGYQESPVDLQAIWDL